MGRHTPAPLFESGANLLCNHPIWVFVAGEFQFGIDRIVRPDGSVTTSPSAGDITRARERVATVYDVPVDAVTFLNPRSPIFLKVPDGDDDGEWETGAAPRYWHTHGTHG